LRGDGKSHSRGLSVLAISKPIGDSESVSRTVLSKLSTGKSAAVLLEASVSEVVVNLSSTGRDSHESTVGLNFNVKASVRGGGASSSVPGEDSIASNSSGDD
jgi:hypothetical protein